MPGRHLIALAPVLIFIGYSGRVSRDSLFLGCAFRGSALKPAPPRPKAVKCCHDLRALANRRGDALDQTGTHVSDGKNAVALVSSSLRQRDCDASSPTPTKTQDDRSLSAIMESDSQASANRIKGVRRGG